MLAFNFASCTFAYRHLAQDLSRALSAFSSFIREYLDKVIKADQCAQYLDDIGIAANHADYLIANLTATFKCFQEAGLKVTMHKCQFGATESDFLGWTITPQGVKPQRQNEQNFLEKTKFPKSKKALKGYLGKLCPKTVWMNALLHSTRCWIVTKRTWYRKNWSTNLRKLTKHLTKVAT